MRQFFRERRQEIDFFPGFYQSSPPDVTGRDVILVDFSYKRPIIDAMATQARSLLIIDHHKTAAEDLAGIQPVFGMGWDRHQDNVIQDACEGLSGKLYCLFDMSRSGAGLAWDFFFPQGRPKLIDIVEDRDLWLFKYPYTRAVNAALFSYPYDFDVWDRLYIQAGEDLPDLVRQGEAIERKHFKDIDELLKVLKHRTTIAGHDVPIANLPYTLVSDAGNIMAQGEPFAACYYDKPDCREYSLRSGPDGLDVQAIARRFGGGGHEHAAGFRVPHGTDVA
ncbi:MAG TPA: phosphohydrolase [Terriglobia bacterium]|nr:phosphohydrolase [Terriglobia bacterium]